MIDEFYLIQNHALGAHLLSEFALHFRKKSKEKGWPPLIIVYYVLPILFNSQTTEILSRKQYQIGSFIHSIIEQRGLFSDINERMENMIQLTNDSISLGFATRALSYDPIECTLITKSTLTKYDEKMYNIQSDYKKMVLVARKLGSWFGELGLSAIIELLKINF